MNAKDIQGADPEVGASRQDTCDHCHLPLDPSEPRTLVGTAAYHRRPNCYLQKLFAIRH